MHVHTPDCTSHGASYSALTFSFLAGGLAGATVALLLAPRSGKATRESVMQGLAGGADGYVTKPFEPEILVNGVKSVLGLS